MYPGVFIGHLVHILEVISTLGNRQFQVNPDTSKAVCEGNCNKSSKVLEHKNAIKLAKNVFPVDACTSI